MHTAHLLYHKLIEVNKAQARPKQMKTPVPSTSCSGKEGPVLASAAGKGPSAVELLNLPLENSNTDFFFLSIGKCVFVVLSFTFACRGACLPECFRFAQNIRLS